MQYELVAELFNDPEPEPEAKAGPPKRPGGPGGPRGGVVRPSGREGPRGGASAKHKRTVGSQVSTSCGFCLIINRLP